MKLLIANRTYPQYQQGTFNIATVEQGNNNSNARKNNACKSQIGNNITHP
jgi:hypothetical protein